MKVNIIPRIVNKLRRCIAIVEDGDTCSISGGIASGKWIIWKGGLYQTSEPISYGNSFAVGTNLIAKDGGIGNQLQTQISELNSKITSSFDTASITIVRGNLSTFTFSNLHDINNASIYKHGLLIWGTSSSSADCGLSFMFIDTQGNVTIHNIYGTSRTLTGSISNGVLTITSNAVVYGGLKLIWFN